MFRSSLLYLSNQPRVFRFVRNNKLAKKFASRLSWYPELRIAGSAWWMKESSRPVLLAAVN